MYKNCIFSDSAPHGSEAPAQYLDKMTSILKEKVFSPLFAHCLNALCVHVHESYIIHCDSY